MRHAANPTGRMSSACVRSPTSCAPARSCSSSPSSVCTTPPARRVSSAHCPPRPPPPPEAQARDTARAYPQRFEWAASIHPYRADALDALAQAKRDGARAVKWLPAVMAIDPASPRCRRFYDALRAHDLPLITHAGAELAVAGHDWDDYGNPLRLRPALDAGVRVVIAHCASFGEDRDLDRGTQGPSVPSFALFERLMNDARYEKNLSADISALTQLNRVRPALARVLEEEQIGRAHV